MPRVSDQHLAARRQQILDAARSCFVRNGFHATSMQDVIGEAGLSVGAVYRYFPSKTDLVTAIAEEVAGEIAGALAELRATPDLSLMQTMERALAMADARAGPDGILRLALQVWAEALRDPAVSALVTRVLGLVRTGFGQLARRAMETGELPAGTDPDATGAALFSLFLGYGLQRVLTGAPDPETYRLGIRTLIATATPATT